LKGVHSDQPIDKAENLREFYYSMPNCSVVEFRQVIDDLASRDAEQAVFEVPEQHADSMNNIKVTAPGLVNKIFDDWEKLGAFFANNETTIARRWKKKSVDKRKKILLEAWPEISLKHRPDFIAMWKG
jgi:hypothetical protein